jgi:integrase/recombinase XerD
VLLSELLEDIKFNCECRRLSEKTTANYHKQVGYLLDYLKTEYGMVDLERVKAKQI